MTAPPATSLEKERGLVNHIITLPNINVEGDIHSYQGPPKPSSKNTSSLPHAIPQRFRAQEPLIRRDLT